MKHSPVRELALAGSLLFFAAYAPGAFAQASVEPPAAGSQQGSDTERALEWTLIRERGLLLQPWSLEAEPGLSYTYQSTQQAQLVQADGQFFVLSQNFRYEALNSSLDLRLGLPLGMQFDVGIPYILQQRLAVSNGLSESTTEETGLGDITLSLNKEILPASGSRLGLLANVLWKTTTGGDSIFGAAASDPSTGTGQLALGSGFHAVQGTLTAVKTSEPLVYFGGLSYTSNISDTKAGLDIDPGDAIGLKVGTILAASPDTSLRFSIDLSRATGTKINGSDLPGSEHLAGILQIGTATILSANTLLDVTAGVGITDTAPDFTLSVSLPVRLF